MPNTAPLVNLFENITDDEHPSEAQHAAAAVGAGSRGTRNRSRSPNERQARSPSPARSQGVHRRHDPYLAPYGSYPHMGPYMPYHAPAYGYSQFPQHPDWFSFHQYGQQIPRAQQAPRIHREPTAAAGAADNVSVMGQMAARPLHEMSDSDRDSEVDDDVASFLRDIEASEAPQEEQGDLLSGYIMPDTPLDAEGPPVADKVKQLVDKYWDNPMTRVQAKELYGVLRRPENLPNLKRTLLNQELQKSLRVQQKARDSQLASIQWGIQFAALPLVAVLEALNERRDLSPQDLVKLTTQTLRLLGRAANQANNMRRDMLRPHLRPQYQPLCRANKYDFEYLLSKDLPGAMKAASDTSRLCNDLVAKQPGFPSKEPGRHYQGANPRKANGPQRDFRQMPPRRHQRAPPNNPNGRNHGRQTGARRGGRQAHHP